MRICVFSRSGLAALVLMALTVIPRQASGVPVQWASGSGGNDHYYEKIDATDISWTSAKAAAEGMSHLGLPGYLATITSAGENSFIVGHFDTGDNGLWIGASDATSEGVWRWVTGPEAGTQFWQGGTGGSTTGPFNYANWTPSPFPEPNNAGDEDYGHIRFELGGALDGTWNDRPNVENAIDHYIVEYSAIPEPATLLLLGSGLLGLGLTRRRRKI